VAGLGREAGIAPRRASSLSRSALDDSAGRPLGRARRSPPRPCARTSPRAHRKLLS